jgi:hypothetical protein
MLTAALLSLTLPLGPLWGAGDGAVFLPIRAEDRIILTSPWLDGVIQGDSLTFIGPSNLLADRSEFGRATAAELMSYATLGDGWDHQGAIAPHPDSIVDALRMLEVTPIEIGAPKPMVLASGDVALYWDLGEAYAEIGFDGSGTYYTYANAPDHESVHLDDILLYDSADFCKFPAAILEILSWEPLKAAA